ncbi:hypothetical protein EJB05_03766, partial [Eragrostis curvula]
MFGMAEKEMEYRVDLFNRLTQTCFNKCIEKRYKESELNMGENSCIDRCVSNFPSQTKKCHCLQIMSNWPPRCDVLSLLCILKGFLQLAGHHYLMYHIQVRLGKSFPNSG